VSTALKESANRTGTGFRQGKARALLVISEVSLAIVLLVGAALLIKTLVALRNVGPGFEARNVLTAEMSMTGAKLHTAAGIADLSRRGRERINSLPGVVVSGSTTWLPIKVDDGLPFKIIGEESKGILGSRWMSFSPGYLDTFRIPVLRGRDFTETDTKANPGVVLINESFAKQFFPDKDPVGQHLLVGVGIGPDTVEPARIIIGIVGDSHNTGLQHPVDAMMMVPTAQVTDAYTAAYSDTSALIWAVKTRDDPHALIGPVSEQLRIASGGYPLGHVRTMDEVMGNSTSRENFNMLLLSIFGLTALILAAIGIYALMAYSVALRTQEMGIRMALGADRVMIRRLIMWQGMRLAIAGLVIGVSAALGLTRLMESLLFGVKAWDPVAFVGAPLLLAGVAMIAVWLPGVRASRVDPIEALRAD
jgi:predicted permease